MTCVLTYYLYDAEIKKYTFTVDLTDSVSSSISVSNGGYNYRFFGEKYICVFTVKEVPDYQNVVQFSIILMQDKNHYEPCDINALRDIQIALYWCYPPTRKIKEEETSEEETQEDVIEGEAQEEVKRESKGEMLEELVTEISVKVNFTLDPTKPFLQELRSNKDESFHAVLRYIPK
jgi:hypothetical protein